MLCSSKFIQYVGSTVAWFSSALDLMIDCEDQENREENGDTH